jgi:hypothetical protein
MLRKLIYGDDDLLMSFVGSANQIKLDATIFRAKLNAIRQQAQSPKGNASVQLLMVQSKGLGVRASKIKEIVMEISRND